MFRNPFMLRSSQFPYCGSGPALQSSGISVFNESGRWVVRCLLFWCICNLTACDKLPKPPRLNKKAVETPAVSTETETVPMAPMETPVEPKPKSPEQILAEFKILKPFEILDEHLQSIADLEIAQAELEILDLSNSRVSDIGLARLANFTNLKSLNVSKSAVQGRSLKALDKLKHLETLTLDATQFDSESSDSLQQFDSLQRLSMRRTGVPDSFYQSISETPQLESLHLDGNRNLLGRHFADLVAKGKFKQLKELSVTDSQFGHYGLLSVQHLDHLEILDARNSGLNLKSMVPISGCKNLKELYLSDNPLSDESISPLKGLKKLERLELASCTGLSDPAVVTLKTMRQLKRLVLTNTSITPKAIDGLRKVLKETDIIFEAGS